MNTRPVSRSRNYLLFNYGKVAWRTLLKNKFTTLISVIGLAIGLTGCLLIGLFIVDELAYDQHFRNKERIYRITSTYDNDGHIYNSAQTGGDVAGELISGMPEIVAATRLLPSDEAFLFFSETAFKEKIIYTDSSFLRVFGFRLLVGDNANCLAKPSSLILSEETAIKYFGQRWRDQNILGTTLWIDGRIPLSVTGVFEDFPRHSHFNSGLFASVPFGQEWMDAGTKLYTYVLLRESSNPQALQMKFQSLMAKSLSAMKNRVTNIRLQSISDIYLFSSLEGDNAAHGNIKNIYALVLISGFLIVITIINFANLYTANAFKRLKEAGVRKVMGAKHNQLWSQVLGETGLLTIIAVGISIMSTTLFLPSFNQFTGKSLSAAAFLNTSVLILIGALTLAIPILAGIYPSLYLTGTKTIDALKGLKNKALDAQRFQRGLIVLQFVISSTMIVLSIVTYRQISLIREKPLGFDKENTIAISNPYMLGAIENIRTFRNELLALGGVEEVSITGYTPSQSRWGKKRLTFPGADDLNPLRSHANWLTVDENFIKALGLTLLWGRNFYEDHQRDQGAVIINEAAVSKYRLDPGDKGLISAELSHKNDGEDSIRTFHVVGVVADFNFGSLHKPVEPIVLHLGYHRFEMAARLSTAFNAVKTIRKVEDLWNSRLPAIPFEYSYISERFNELHKADISAGKLFSIFCFLTITMSALGLFSIVSISVKHRSKEISIRKILGASSWRIVITVAHEFLILVGTAYLIALPLAWFLAQRWMDDFAYKTGISWWIFALTALSLLIVTALSLGYQSVKASLANPVDALRHE